MKAEKILRVLLQEFIEKYSNSHISLGELKRIRGTLWKLWKLDPAKAHFQGMLCEAVDGNPCISLWDNTPLSGKRKILCCGYLLSAERMASVSILIFIMED